MKETVACRELAEALGLTERRVQQLAKQEVLVKAERGNYLYVPNLLKFIAYQKEQISGEGKDYAAENTRLTKERADHEALKVRELKGQLIRIDDVIQLVSGLAVQARKKFQDVPKNIIQMYQESLGEIDDKQLRLAHSQADEYVDDVLRELSEVQDSDLFSRVDDEEE